MDTSAYLPVYLQEMRENCAKLGQALMSLEARPTEEGVLAEVMRLAHSLKGASATMGFERTEELTHALEDIFDAARKGKFGITPACIDVCLKALDALENAVVTIEQTHSEPEEYGVQSQLKGFLESDNPRSKEGFIDEGGAAPHTPSSPRAMPYVRVESKKLDSLLEAAGELSILSLQLKQQCAASKKDDALSPLLDRLDKITDELTYQVTQSRLIPLNQVFMPFPRLVRDLARSLKKDISFTMNGTDIELDKTLVDQLSSPLVHLIKNAVDHGIEPADARKKLGKNSQGRISIDVVRQQGFVEISVEDDGAFITTDEIRSIAKTKGFSPAEIAAITDATLLDVLCSGRLSSTSSVTMISGRGVGLFAVQSSVRSLGGQLSLKQFSDHKRFTLTLPLSVSIVQVLFARAAGSVYGLPFVHVERLLAIPQTDVRSALSQPVAIVENQELPLLSLSKLLGNASTDSSDKNLHQVIVVHGTSGLIGLIVDDVVGSEEVMVKPITEHGARTSIIVGSTIAGDGSVVLILDVPHVLNSSSRNSDLPVGQAGAASLLRKNNS